MTVIHANDSTTAFLSQLYEEREDLRTRITESATNSDVIRAIRADDTIMMLGHGTKYGLFSKPEKNGQNKRLLITDRHVEFLRSKTCIGIWCHADEFASHYGLHGLFSGMIISELEEVEIVENEEKDKNGEKKKIHTTQEEIDEENKKVARRLKFCLDNYPLNEIPQRMRELDDVKSELTNYNYNNLYFFENIK